MKAELNKDGYIVVSPETVAESFALQYLTAPGGPVCSCCGRNDISYPIIFNLALDNGVFPRLVNKLTDSE